MIHNALIAELQAAFPDVPAYFGETPNVDEYPPYFVINKPDSTPEVSGTSGRWQITGADTDQDALMTRMENVKKLFHNTFGSVGGELVADMKVVLEVGPSKNEGGSWEAHTDLRIYYR